MTGTPGTRRASAADLPAVREVIAEAYGKYLSRMDRPPAPLLRDHAPAIEAGTLWVTGDPVTGLISLIPQGGSLLIENVAVSPRAQGSGIGRALMDFAERQARRLKAARLALYTSEVMAENLAIYAHLGYQEVERKAVDGYRRVYLEKPLP